MNASRTTILLLLVSSACLIQGQDKKTAEIPSLEFLNLARRPPVRESWAKFNGFAQHRRSGKSTQKLSLYLGIRFTPERTLAQVVVGNRESYRIGQTYRQEAGSTTVIPENIQDPRHPLLGNFGLRPEDLTLSFLYWNYDEELAGESVKTIKCRVFLLQSPDQQELARIYISTEYRFPVKVEWLYQKNDEKPYRTLEISSVKETDNIHLPDSLMLFGPGWKTKVDFSETAAGIVAENLPDDLFRKITPQEKSRE